MHLFPNPSFGTSFRHHRCLITVPVVDFILNHCFQLATEATEPCFHAKILVLGLVCLFQRHTSGLSTHSSLQIGQCVRHKRGAYSFNQNAAREGHSSNMRCSHQSPLCRPAGELSSSIGSDETWQQNGMHSLQTAD